MPFLPPNLQRQSSEGHWYAKDKLLLKIFFYISQGSVVIFLRHGGGEEFRKQFA